MRLWALLLCAAIATLGTSVAQAHHSFAAEFDANKPITLRGVVKKVELVNPHGWIYVDVKVADGSTTSWAIEAGSATQLLRLGLRKTDFPIGAEVVIKGFLARNGKPIANGTSVTFPDGRDFFLGGEPGR